MRALQCPGRKGRSFVKQQISLVPPGRILSKRSWAGDNENDPAWTEDRSRNVPRSGLTGSSLKTNSPRWGRGALGLWHSFSSSIQSSCPLKMNGVPGELPGRLPQLCSHFPELFLTVAPPGRSSSISLGGRPGLRGDSANGPELCEGHVAVDGEQLSPEALLSSEERVWAELQQGGRGVGVKSSWPTQSSLWYAEALWGQESLSYLLVAPPRHLLDIRVPRKINARLVDRWAI